MIYILHDGEVTTKNVTLDGNVASFEADKFLTYAIAYIDTVMPIGDTNPTTVDNILTYVVLSIVSVGGIVGVGIYLKKNKEN